MSDAQPCPTYVSCCKEFAVALGGTCYNLPELRADTLLHTVKREIDA